MNKDKQELISVDFFDKLLVKMDYIFIKENTTVFLIEMLEKKQKEDVLNILYEEIFKDNPHLVYRCALESGLKKEEYKIIDEIIKGYENHGLIEL